MSIAQPSLTRTATPAAPPSASTTSPSTTTSRREPESEDPMRPWPGSAYPLGASYDGAGTNFAIFSEIAERVELCLFADDGDRDPGRPARGRRVRLARLPAHRGAGPALRLPDPRPVRPRQGPAVQPEQAADRPLREGRRRPGAVGRGGVRLPVRLAGRAQREGLRAVRAEVGGRQPVLRLGHATAIRASPTTRP